MIIRRSFILCFLFLFPIIAIASGPVIIISGKITDAASGEAVSYATIYRMGKEEATWTNDQGMFSFSAAEGEKVGLRISYLGYQPVDTVITARRGLQLQLRMEIQDFSLKEVVVSAKESGDKNATSIIEKKALEHIQPSSFTDIIQLLPGHSTKDPNLSNPNFISMRQAGSDVNTSLGSAFVINGMQVSNDANLQNMYGMPSDKISTNKGIDMRTIATDRIESVEIVRGIPSVQYGDLTAGLVKINLKGGKTPWEVRVKTDLNNKLISMGKGFKLPKNQGLLNFDMDYMNYNPDPRTEISSYKRATFSGRYENNYRLSEHRTFRLQTNLSYTGSFDNNKKDPDYLTGEDDYYKNSFNNLSLSTNGILKFNRHFLKEIAYSLSANYTQEKLDVARWVSPGVMPVPTATEEGPHDAGYLPSQYASNFIVDGRPLDINSGLSVKKDWTSNGFIQHFALGGEYRYSKNIGDGEQYDPNLPPYPGQKTSRPRSFSDIPALQKLAFYADDNIRWEIDRWDISVNAGVRATTLPGLSSNYEMRGKLYWEPRFNARITLPRFTLFDRKAALTITGGAGRMYKFPTQSQLYPETLYLDYIQLNYYSQQEELRALNVYTYVENPENYRLQPALNIKYEAGLAFKAGKFELDLTFFRENMDNGFSSENRFVSHTYKDYDESSVPAGSITVKPDTDDFTYVNDTLSALYSIYGNAAGVYKQGIEYQLKLGEIPGLYTDVWLNGAWFKTHYTHNSQRYYKPSVTINNDYYPYVGIYDYWENANYTRSQCNTNAYFDTHIPQLRMVFTTSVQSTWFEKRKDDWDSGLPTAYLDNAGRRYPFTEATLETVDYIDRLVDIHTPYDFLEETIPVACNVNLKLTKEIGKYINLAFYVNRVLSYLPSYTSVRGMTMIRNTSPSFGAELKIKL